MNKWDYLVGDARDVLKTLEPESIQCVVTSPPYWGLRDYGIEPSIWGGKSDCKHEWGEVLISKNSGGGWNLPEERHKYPTMRLRDPKKETTPEVSQGCWCQLCGAWRGCLGLEPTPELYIQHLVEVFKDVKRVIRKDGTLWLNMGDSYFGGGRGGHPSKRSENWQPEYPHKGHVPPGCKQKDLVGMPWRVALSLQGDGWWLRSDIIWSKPNPMPESATDRPTKAHEYVFLMSKSKSYFYDANAIREESTGQNGLAANFKRRTKEPEVPGQQYKQHREERKNRQDNGTRNKRTVWEIATQSYPEAHFAVFPEALVEPCVLAGTSPKACGKCGAPWKRKIKKTFIPQEDVSVERGIKGAQGQKPMYKDNQWEGVPRGSTNVKTLGWTPTCRHNDNSGVQIVLDPFAGSGTTIVVARRLGRSAIGIDINPEYEKLAKDRAKLRVPDITSFEEGICQN